MFGEVSSNLMGFLITTAVCSTSTPLADHDGAPSSHYPFSIEDILSLEVLPTPDPIAVSPDGKWLAVTVQSHRRRRHGGGESGRYLPTGFPIWLEGSEIWIVDVEIKEYQNLTPDWGTSWRPSWSPLLLIHGELDTSASAQAGEMFSGLRRLGKKAVLARYLMSNIGQERGATQMPLTSGGAY